MRYALRILGLTVSAALVVWGQYALITDLKYAVPSKYIGLLLVADFTTVVIFLGILTRGTRPILCLFVSLALGCIALFSQELGVHRVASLIWGADIIGLFLALASLLWERIPILNERQKRALRQYVRDHIRRN